MGPQLGEHRSAQARNILPLALAAVLWAQADMAHASEHGAQPDDASAGESAVAAAPAPAGEAGYPAPESATAVPGAYGPDEEERPASSELPPPPGDSTPQSAPGSGYRTQRPPQLDAEPSERASTGSFQLALGVSYIVAPLLLIATASPLQEASLAWLALPAATHTMYDDPGGGVISLVGYPGSIMGAGLLGVAIETAQCGHRLLCGLAGAAVGGLIGAVSWSLIDIFAIAPATRGEVAARGRRRSALALGGGPVPGGGLALSLSGRL